MFVLVQAFLLSEVQLCKDPFVDPGPACLSAIFISFIFSPGRFHRIALDMSVPAGQRRQLTESSHNQMEDAAKWQVAQPDDQIRSCETANFDWKSSDGTG